LIARLGCIKEPGIVARGEPTARHHFKTLVFPLARNVFTIIDDFTIIVYVEVNGDKIT
jgi:hypothetical protein